MGTVYFVPVSLSTVEKRKTLKVDIASLVFLKVGYQPSLTSISYSIVKVFLFI